MEKIANTAHKWLIWCLQKAKNDKKKIFAIFFQLVTAGFNQKKMIFCARMKKFLFSEEKGCDTYTDDT